VQETVLQETVLQETVLQETVLQETVPTEILEATHSGRWQEMMHAATAVMVRSWTILLCDQSNP
jgi:hypothetical protein